MKKIVIGTSVVVAGAVAAVLIAAAMGPDTFLVQRSIVINAKPEKIAAHIVDFRKWTSWSPYEKLDPAMKRTFSGAEAGTGAVYEWSGGWKVGSGRMEITGVAPSRITIKFDFHGPIEGRNAITFTFVPEGASTKVTWAMCGPNRFIGKIMHVVFSMDRMVGNAYDTGLLNLKTIAEK